MTEMQQTRVDFCGQRYKKRINMKQINTQNITTKNYKIPNKNAVIMSVKEQNV